LFYSSFILKISGSSQAPEQITAADFEYERAIAQVNKAMYEGIETVFLLTMPEHTPVNSTIVRDIIRNGGDASKFLPKGMDIHDQRK
jgi:pantetheine-phosphate adenylyltransferase